MRFHGLMLLRDEIDIISQNLDHLLTWIDNLFILDMGSVDGTWDLVQSYAKKDPRIVPVFSKPIVFDDNQRSLIFNQFRNRFDPGDWVLRIDADEFYHLTPPNFVAQRLLPLETAVYLQWYFFRLTRQEVADYESGKVDLAADRQRPISDRRRYYKISTYPEPRMFRYRKSMQWPHNVSFPYNAGFVSRQRIPIRHYPHRDPEQMKRRFQLRAAVMKVHAHAGSHWKLADWRQDLVDAPNSPQSPAQFSSPAPAQRQGLAGESGVDTGPLLYWQPGTELIEQPLHNHIPPFPRRLAQRLIHPLLLPFLDSRRPHYDTTHQPKPLPNNFADNLYT